MRSTKLKHWKKNLQLSLIKESSVINGLVRGAKYAKLSFDWLYVSKAMESIGVEIEGQMIKG